MSGFMAALCLQSWTMPVSGGAQGRERDFRKVLETLDEKMKGVETIQTNFTQIKRLQMFKHEIVLKGSAYLQKPGRFAWHTKTPVRNSIVLKDTKVFQWNEEIFR
jgi:outer membrane lipoprotein-sorting protein